MTRGVHPSVTTRERKGELALALCGLAARAEHLWHVGPAIGQAAATEGQQPCWVGCGSYCAGPRGAGGWLDRLGNGRPAW
jgi:hypothetical protein